MAKTQMGLNPIDHPGNAKRVARGEVLKPRIFSERPERLYDDQVEWNNIWRSLLTQARNAHSLVIPTVAEDLLSEF